MDTTSHPTPDTQSYKGRSTGSISEGPQRDQPPVDDPPPEEERPPAPREPSRYAKRSAHLPHLGDAADHEVLEGMRRLRADSPQR